MAHPPDDALSKQVAQGKVDGRVRLAEDERQLRRIDEGRPAEGVRLRASSNSPSEGELYTCLPHDAVIAYGIKVIRRSL